MRYLILAASIFTTSVYANCGYVNTIYGPQYVCVQDQGGGNFNLQDNAGNDYRYQNQGGGHYSVEDQYGNRASCYTMYNGQVVCN